MPRVIALLAVTGLALGATGARADERILSFDSVITVERDGTLDVRETIRVRAEGHDIRRGIYRDFPTLYPADGGRQIAVGFGFDSATRDGNPEPWRVENQSNGVRIYLGSAAVMLPPGEHVYELAYHTDRQLGFFADHDELYWNVNGLGWNFVIDELSARVVLPADIPRDSVKLEAYTGGMGERGGDYRASFDGADAVFHATRAMSPHDGMTIVASWPKGFVTAAATARPPSLVASPGYDFARDSGSGTRRRFDSLGEAILKRDLPHDGRPVWFALGGLALLLLYYWRTWLRVGRDPPGRVIIPEYESPPGLSAAAMRYLDRMGYDDKCFAAAILALAVKGHLRIEEHARLLGLGKTYTLVRSASGAAATPSEDEGALLGRLFQGADSIELLQKNHATIRAARRLNQTAIERRYKQGFFSVNGGWHFLGGFLSVLVIGVSLAQPGALLPWPKWFFVTPAGWVTLGACLACIVVNIVFGRLLRAPTVAGQEALDHIRGFRMYLEVAEGAELERAQAPPPKLTPQLYEAYLPAALALGVEQHWAEKFTRVLDVDAPNYRPGWYAGNSFNAASVGSFSSNLGSSLSSAISSSSTAPGSHSGGGGGGSSGGGGGGGGGGGW